MYCSHGEQTAGRPLVRLPRFGGWCAVGGRPLCPVGGLQAREWPAKIQIKATLFPSSPLRDRGEEDEQCRSKRHRSALSFSFFFLECMKRRRFGENAPFHLNVAPKRAKFQISPQSSFCFFNCIPAEFEPRPDIWPRFSLWSLAFELCN